MSLISDGLTKAQFMPLWKEAMWHAVDPMERARLVLELGRLHARGDGVAGPLLIACIEHRDPPLVVMPVAEVPSARLASGVRARVRERLADLGASEVYLLATLDAAKGRVLVSWGEHVVDGEVCMMLAYRVVDGEVEEATPIVVPDASTTEISRQCAGLLTPVH